MTVIYGGPNDDTLTGSADADQISGRSGNDVVYGGDGNDILDGGTGFDYMRGGLGDDIYYVDSVYDIVDEDIGGGGTYDRVNSTVSFASATIEAIVLEGTADINATLTSGLRHDFLGNSGNNILTGGAGEDRFYGGAGNDVLYGGDGGDVLEGGSGFDYMRGGLGNDTYSVDSIYDVVDEDIGGGGINDTVFAYVSFSSATIETVWLFGDTNINATLSGILGSRTFFGGNGDNILTGGAGSDYFYASAGNDAMYGGGGRDSLSGEAGNDVMYGGDGNDDLHGGTGNDILAGGAGADYSSGGDGNDTYYVDDAEDSVIESLTAAGGTADYIYSSVSYTAVEGIEGIGLLGSDNLNATGLDGQTDILIGNSGNNILDGKGDYDYMAGGLGNDTYYVDNISDSTVEAAGGGTADYVYSSVSFTAAAGIEGLILTGSANIYAVGANGQDDLLIGNSGNNSLLGLSGNDYLLGGAGSDYFAFYYDVVAGQADVIGDFEAGADYIGLPSYVKGSVYVLDTAYGVDVACYVSGGWYQILVSNTHNINAVQAGIYYSDI
jgi:trimeric autotransporter adhesin